MKDIDGEIMTLTHSPQSADSLVTLLSICVSSSFSVNSCTPSQSVERFWALTSSARWSHFALMVINHMSLCAWEWGETVRLSSVFYQFCELFSSSLYLVQMCVLITWCQDFKVKHHHIAWPICKALERLNIEACFLFSLWRRSLWLIMSSNKCHEIYCVIDLHKQTGCLF